DESAIKQAFKDMGLGYVVPEKVYRLKRNRNAPTSAPRKMKVVLAGHHEQKLVLEEKKLLKEYEEWNGVYFQASRPLDERMAESVLRSQGGVLNERLHGKQWRNQLDNAVTMVKFWNGKLWNAKRNDPGQYWRRVSVIPDADLPPPPPRQRSQSQRVTTQRPQAAAQPPVMAAWPPVVKAQPQVVAAQPPVVAVQPPVVAAQPPVVAVQPPVGAAQPSVVAAEPQVVGLQGNESGGKFRL
ncbi:MAG: hypothetical protein GY696_11715, partial [Gammaproteobacteria bacterium]|nr:hypothetical protein [Gammaproteobacteria bacterium]